jgi:hypothetical protein
VLEDVREEVALLVGDEVNVDDAVLVGVGVEVDV